MECNGSKKIHRTMIGGQAVIEGVMMRGVGKTALAVRKPDGDIELEVWDTASWRDKNPILRCPIVRGVISFVEMLVFGYKTIAKSAEIAGLEDSSSTSSKTVAGISDGSSDNVSEHINSGNPGDGKNNGIGEKAMDALTLFSTVIGFVIAIFLFAVLPTIIIGNTEQFVHWGAFRTIAEGVIKIAIFVIYLVLIAQMKDIQRIYQYHGAEHKAIYCYEHGDDLTPERAKNYVRFHPRCGTSFILIVLIIGIFIFSFVTWKTLWLRIVLKIILLPLVIGVSYEIIKFAGRHDNSFMRFLLAPGLWLQRLTTREPDEEQLEVAIKSLKAVLPENPQDDLW